MLTAALWLTSSAHAGFEVSSFRKEDKLGKTYWSAASALDSKMETCWQVDPEQPNVGQWIQMDVPASEVDKIGVVVGWAKDDDTFGDYARIKAAKVEILDGSSGAVVATANVSFEDKNGWQIIDLPDTKIGTEVSGGKVKLTVTDVYPGKDYPSLAVSEVRVHLKEFPAASMTLSRPFDTESGSNSAAMATDGNAKTFWAATAPSANFAMKGPGYGLASLGIQSGPKAFARPKTVEITANQAVVTHVLPDTPGALQWVLLPCLVGYTGGSWGEVEIKIVDSYPGDVATNGVAIAELKLNAGSIEEF
ncbi:MAG: discoidin domain-containing protein [Myxococcota bacterium]